MNYVNKAVHVAADESKSLEELACLRMRAMANNGASYFAFASVVNQVRSVHNAEHRARVARKKALADLIEQDRAEY